MSDHERTSTGPEAGPGNGAGNGATVVALRPHAKADEPKPPRRRVRIRKLRLFLLLLGLGILAAVSTVFGMMMAVASDLPEFEPTSARNSEILDKDGHPLGF